MLILQQKIIKQGFMCRGGVVDHTGGEGGGNGQVIKLVVIFYYTWLQVIYLVWSVFDTLYIKVNFYQL